MVKFSALSALASVFAFTADAAEFNVRVRNLTYLQPFSPPLIVAHTKDVALFKEGFAANDAIKLMAEDGNNSALLELAASEGVAPYICGAVVADGPLFPGETWRGSMMVDEIICPDAVYSAVTMLFNTNDAFLGIDSANLNFRGSSKTYPPAFDAVHKHEDDTGNSGDGQAASHPGDNPDDYFNKKILLRAQLNKMGEPVTDRRFKDICIQGIIDEYNDVKLMVFRDPSFALGEIQSTMRNIFLDSQSRATPFFKMHHKSPDLSGLRTIGARAFVHHERYRKKLDDRAFEGKLCGYRLDSKTYRIFNPSNGTVVECQNVTFIETPPRSVSYQYSDEAHGYESDVLNFTSLLGPENPTTTAALDFPTQNEVLRQEIRHMQQDNFDREGLRLELEQDDIQDQEEASPGTESPPGGVSMDAHNSGGSGDSGPHGGPGGAAESGGASDQDGSSDAAGDAATKDTSRPAAPAESSSTSGANHSGGASATGAARSGMPRLEVTRASTRRKPTHDDPVDLDLLSGALTVTMNDDGIACGTTRMAISTADPATLTFDQLSAIAAQSSQPCPGGFEDFVHFPEDPATGYVYATRSEAPHELLEEMSQALKIPNTYAEAMNSPQHEELKGACANEMKSLKKHNVYTLVPLSSVPKTDKILGTKFVFKKKLDGRFKARLVVAFGWKRTRSDPCVYTYTDGATMVILSVYVEDFLMTGEDQDLVSKKKRELTDRFEMTDLDEVKRILGIEVKRVYEQGTLSISQVHYVETILERFGMQDANPFELLLLSVGLSSAPPKSTLPEEGDRGTLPSSPSGGEAVEAAGTWRQRTSKAG
eukprot:g15509.t1